MTNEIIEPTYKELTLPNYVNTHVVATIAGIDLTVPDALKAVVLSGLNALIVSDTGWGKTQAISDIYHSYFGGNKNGIRIKARPDTEIEDIFFRLNMEAVRRELNTASVEKLIYFIDEVNRSPPPIQDKFLGMGDGTMETPDGKVVYLGNETGYSILLATANIGNGEFAGTWELDRALLNRLHITLDLDYFSLEDEDEIKVNKMGSANPKVIKSEDRDISGKILAAWRKINKEVEEPGLEAEIALMCLGPGLRQCLLRGNKTRSWPETCQDCEHAGKEGKKGNLCEMIKQAAPRTRRSVLRYATAMKYLAKLKAKHLGKTFDQDELDPYDLIFTAYKLAGAYHGNLNPHMLSADYYDENARMMEDVYQQLRDHVGGIVDNFVDVTMECYADFGELVTSFVRTGKTVYPVCEKWFENQAQKKAYEGGGKKLLEDITGKSEVIKPYEEGSIRMKWLPDMIRKHKK